MVPFFSSPGSSLELGSGRQRLGSEPARSLEESSGGVKRLEAWLEEEEAGLYLLEERAWERAGLVSSARLRRESFPTASSKPKQ